MLGIAIGDAFGAAYENLPRTEVKRIFDPTKYTKNPLFEDHIPGTYTDDTQMSIAVAESISSGKEFTTQTLANNFVLAFKRDVRPGYSKYSFQALQASNSGEEFLAKVTKSSEKNGACMRAIPIGVIQDIDKVIDLCVVNAETTHHSPSAIASSVTIGLASHYFFHNMGEVKSALDFCLQHLSANSFDEASIEHLNKILQMEEIDFEILLGKQYASFGVPPHGMKTAGVVLYLISKLNKEPFETLKEAVLLGGDTDTTASITLGILCSRFEVEDMPDFLLEGLENGAYGREYIAQVGEKLGSVLKD